MALLAGAPFYISPTELYDMDGDDLRYWQGLAARRIKIGQDSTDG